MTRTARSSSIRAINRDRSESKSGLDKSIRKNGAGSHNWGSLIDERQHDFGAMDDEGIELEEESSSDNLSSQSEPLEEKKPGMQANASAVSTDDLETAKKFRKHALKTAGLDLAAIARTSSAVTSPKLSPGVQAQLLV